MIKLLFTILVIHFSFFVYSQEEVHKCSAHLELEKLLKNKNLREQFEKDQLLLKNEELLKQGGQNKSGTIYTIPIVFHVLHNDGAENISDEQINDALRILNRDFRKQNQDANNVVASFQNIIADVEIEFKLATIAPNGECFAGVTRTRSSKTEVSGNIDGYEQMLEIQGNNDVFQGYWNPSKYMNIYVCKSIGGAAGYTFLPFGSANGDMFYNGIFMLSNYIGSIGTGASSRSRTLTHEVGHWLNLPHTWGSTNEPDLPSNCNTDDGVLDTPNTIGVRFCNINESSCGVTANVENYMDYSYCSKMFTEGQKTRMRTALTSSVAGRNILWSPGNLVEVGAVSNLTLCKADFITENTLVCSNNSVQFLDKSLHNATSWSWSFAGGTPSVSTNQNPSVVYDTPGEYSVTLTVSDGVTSLTQTKTNYVTVLNETGIAPIKESFETVNSIPSSDWFVDFSDENLSWSLINGASSTGNISLSPQNRFSPEGEVFELISTTTTLDLNLSATITFDYAFARKDDDNNDRLRFFVSNDCGQTWFLKKSISGSTLRTAPNTSGNFMPNSDQWKTSTVSSGSLNLFLESDFRMKFVFESGGGNNFYLDNININGPVSVEESKVFADLEVYPNPSTDVLHLKFNTNNNANYKIRLLDMIGKELEVITDKELFEGNQEFIIETKKYQSGIYFISVESNGIAKLHKFMVK